MPKRKAIDLTGLALVKSCRNKRPLPGRDPQVNDCRDTGPACVNLVPASQLIQALDLVHFCGYIDADFVFDPSGIGLVHFYGTILLEIPVPRALYKRVRLMGAMVYGMDVQGVWNETLVDIRNPQPLPDPVPIPTGAPIPDPVPGRFRDFLSPLDPGEFPDPDPRPSCSY